MNIARAMVIVVLGFAGLALAWTGIEGLQLANGAACRGNDVSFLRVVGPDSTAYTVVQDTNDTARCAVQDVDTFAGTEGWKALGEDVTVEPGTPWLVDAAYSWDDDGYEIAEDSLAGRLFIGARFGIMGGLLLLLFIMALTFRELMGRWL